MKRISQTLAGGVVGLSLVGTASASVPPAAPGTPPNGGPVAAVLQEVQSAMREADTALQAASNPRVPPARALSMIRSAEAALLYANGAVMALSPDRGASSSAASSSAGGAASARSQPPAPASGESNAVQSQLPPQTGQAGGGAGATSPRAENATTGAGSAAEGGAPSTAQASNSPGGVSQGQAAQGAASTAQAKPGFKPEETAKGGMLAPGQAEEPGTADDQSITPSAQAGNAPGGASQQQGKQGAASAAQAEPGFKPEDTAKGGMLAPNQAEIPGTVDDQSVSPSPQVSGTEEFHTPSQESEKPAVSVRDSGSAGERSGAAAMESGSAADSGGTSGQLAPQEAEQPGVQDNTGEGGGGQMVAKAEPATAIPQLSLERANKLIGKQAVSPEGKELGQIVRIDAGPGDEVRRVVIQYGGVLGMFEHKAAVNKDRIVAVRDDRLVVDVAPDQRDSLPRVQ